MVDLILTTFDWVPKTPRGYVRDIRVRWALEEAALPYRVESVPLTGREWLAGTFSVADIFMADVLRLADRFDGLAGHPACRDYVARATARPSFVKAHADQMAHFAAAD
jgi:glutathione S-transferase